MNLSNAFIISLILVIPAVASADLPTTGGGFQCKVTEVYAGQSSTWESSARLPLRVSRGPYDPIAGTNYYNETIIFASRVLPTNVDISLSFNQFVCGNPGAPLVEFPCESIGYHFYAKYLDQSLTLPPADFFVGQKSGNLNEPGELNTIHVIFNKPGFDYNADITCSVHSS